MRLAVDRLVLVADLLGTAVFAIEGALGGIAGQLDFLGVMVIAFVTALGGGIIRDVLLGATPPSAVRDWRYPATALLAGAVTFLFVPLIRDVPLIALIWLDAMGLALFAVAGTEKALDHGIAPFIAIFFGTITAVGGGTVRDVLLARIPLVLNQDIYATAALFGALVLVLLRQIGWSARPAAILGGIACFLLRVVAVWQHWQLPKAPG